MNGLIFAMSGHLAQIPARASPKLIGTREPLTDRYSPQSLLADVRTFFVARLAQAPTLELPKGRHHLFCPLVIPRSEVSWIRSAHNMLTESNLRDPTLINTIGHMAGLLLFGFIIILFLRDHRAHGIRRSKLSIIAAALALGWNVGSLVALGAGDPGSVSMAIVMTASFAVLSLLPAVLLQMALQGQLEGLTNAGYAVSAAAIVLHVSELFMTVRAPHQAALLLVAVGFGVLTWLRPYSDARQRT